MKLQQASQIAESVVEKLRHYCHEIKVAGSIRRCKEEVGDIEIVCIPHQKNGAHRNDFCLAVWNLGDVYWGHGSGIHKSKALKINLPEGIKLNLSMTHREKWANILLMKTGSKDFVQSIRDAFNRRGCYSESGIIHNKAGEKILFESEKEIFDFLGMEWIAPEYREQPVSV